MARQTFKIEGLRDLEKSLGELPKATGKNVLRRVLRKVGQPIADMAQSLAPDDPATSGKRDLKTSITVGSRLGRRQAALHRKMFKDDRASVEIFVGAGVLPHPHLQEFGTEGHGPQPFMRPAWDANKLAALDTVKADLWTEIDKSAKRLARKQARLAAKG